MKYAVEFQFIKDKNGSLEYDGYTIIGDEWWIAESFDFEYDYWDWFKDNELNPNIKEIEPGRYHVFHYGDVHEEWSENWEYGREFDGFIFEPEHENIVLLNDYEESSTPETTL